jgi:sugar phosphate isomerase/epimerase
MTDRRRWTLAVSQWTLLETSAARAIGRIADAGFDAVELGGDSLDPTDVKRALAASGLDATSICPFFGAERDFAADAAEVRAAASDHLRRSIDLAGEVGADAVIVVPSDRPAGSHGSTRADLLSRCAETIGEVVGEYPVGGPMVVIEPLNRYETHLVRTLEEAESLRGLIDSPHVALMADVFHMNLEEDSLSEPLRQHAGRIAHVHLADNQRREPGSGRLDFAEVFDVLDEIDYRGHFALEFLPATDAALLRAREHLRPLMAASGQRAS